MWLRRLAPAKEYDEYGLAQLMDDTGPAWHAQAERVELKVWHAQQAQRRTRGDLRTV